MTAERDGKSRRTGQPDLLASLPDERPPASQPAPGIDPASIEELLDRGAGPPRAIYRTEGSGGRRPACASACGTDAGGARGLGRQSSWPVSPRPRGPRTRRGTRRAATRIKRIEDAAARAAAAAERIDGGLEGTADRVTAEVGAAATRIEAGFRITRDHVDRNSRLVHRAVEELRTRVGRAEVRFRDGSCGLDRLRPGHVAREPHTHPLQLAVSTMSRRRSPSLPLARTGAALSEA